MEMIKNKSMKIIIIMINHVYVKNKFIWVNNNKNK